MPRFSRFLPFLVFMVLAGVVAFRLDDAMQKDTVSKISMQQDPVLGSALPLFSLPSLDASLPPLTQADFAGKTIILNYFASWCAACKAEYPVLAAFARRHSLPVYGIAWKDDPQKLAFWIANVGDVYQRTVLDKEGALAIALGLKGVPETYLVQNGRIIAVYRGALSEDAVTNFLEPVLAEGMR